MVRRFPLAVGDDASSHNTARPGPPFPARADPEYTAYSFGECGAGTAVVHHPIAASSLASHVVFEN